MIGSLINSYRSEYSRDPVWDVFDRIKIEENTIGTIIAITSLSDALTHDLIPLATFARDFIAQHAQVSSFKEGIVVHFLFDYKGTPTLCYDNMRSLNQLKKILNDSFKKTKHATRDP